MSQQSGSEPDETSAKPKDHQLAPGPARLLVLIAAGLALVIYVLGFLNDLGLGSLFAGPLVLGGGLLAGAAVLPKVGRVLLPAAVAVITGTLLLLQGVTGTPGAPTMMIVALVLSFLLVAAVVAAVLLDAGILTMPAPRPSAPPGYPQPGYGTYGQPPRLRRCLRSVPGAGWLRPAELRRRHPGRILRLRRCPARLRPAGPVRFWSRESISARAWIQPAHGFLQPADVWPVPRGPTWRAGTEYRRCAVRRLVRRACRRVRRCAIVGSPVRVRSLRHDARWIGRGRPGP